MHRVLAAVCAALAVALPACGGDESPPPPPDPAQEPADAPAKPPRGWRTLVNERVGFSVSVPRDWTARKRRSATVVRSDDGLLVLTIAADRGEPGRTLPVADYARATLEGLPGFTRLRPRPGPAVEASPYENATVAATGRRTRAEAATAERQRVSVTAFRRPGRVTYTVVAFRNAEVEPRRHRRALARLLASLRGRPPAL